MNVLTLLQVELRDRVGSDLSEQTGGTHFELDDHVIERRIALNRLNSGRQDIVKTQAGRWVSGENDVSRWNSNPRASSSLCRCALVHTGNSGVYLQHDRQAICQMDGRILRQGDAERPQQ